MMRNLLLTTAAAAAAAVAAVAPLEAMGPSAATRGEARLARALEGRVAGEPVDCIDLRRVRSSRIVDDTAIVYEVGRLLYVNRPRSGADSLDRRDVMVTRPFGSRLCSVDVVELFDSGLRMPTGLVFLGDFVPYRRVKDRPAP